MTRNSILVMSHDRDAVRTAILDAAERLLGRYGYGR